MSKNLHVGLYITDHSVDLVLAEGTQHGHALRLHAHQDLPKGIIRGEKILKSGVLTTVIRAMVVEHKLDEITCTIAIGSCDGSSLHLIKTRIESQEFLEDEVSVLADSRMPWKLDSLFLDARIVRPDEGINQMDVILGGMKRELALSYHDVVASAGLNPTGFSFPNVALANRLISDESAEAIGACIGLAFGSECVHMVLADGKQFVSSGVIPLPSIVEAEHFDVMPAKEQGEVRMAEANVFAHEILRRVDLYQQMPYVDLFVPQRIYLCGLDSESEEMKQVFAKMLHADTIRLLPPFISMPVYSNVSDLQQIMANLEHATIAFELAKMSPDNTLTSSGLLDLNLLRKHVMFEMKIHAEDLIVKYCPENHPYGTRRLTDERALEYLQCVKSWNFTSETTFPADESIPSPTGLGSEFEFEDFTTAFRFITAVAMLIETEQCYPYIALRDRKKVWILNQSCSAEGLCENDFIMALKITDLHKRYFS